jgi:NADH-quinone oxidoreductase subunit N
VYQGTTNANAGLLAVAPKIAGIAGIIRLALVAMPAAGDFGWQLALVLAVLTMTIGNICALWQNNLRRLMAYSSIAHGGYLLIGLAAAALATTPAGLPFGGGIAAMLIYVAVYAVATMGTFAALAYLGSQSREVSGVDELAGLARSQPLVAGLIALFMFSLAGIPPLAGFWGKLALFSSAVEVAAGSDSAGTSLWFTLLAIVGAANAAIAAAYYLRIVATMYFQPAAADSAPAGGWGALAAAALCGVLVVACGVLPGPAMNSASDAEETLRHRAPIVRSVPPALPAIAAADPVLP